LNKNVRLWLPDGAENLHGLLKEINAAIHEWSILWTPQNELKCEEIEAGSKNLVLETTMERSLVRSGFEFWTNANTRGALAGEILGVDFDRLQPLEKDQKAVNGIVDESLSELKLTVSAIFGTEFPSTGIPDKLKKKEYHLLAVSADGKEPVFYLAISSDLLAQYTRNNIPRTFGGGPLGHRWSAVDGTSIRIGSRIGQAKISLADLSQLEAGDVVTLNRELSDLLDLTVNGSVTAEEQISLEQSPEGMRLILST